jgi:hypothetical protein
VLMLSYCAEPIAPRRTLNLKSVPIPNGGRNSQYIHDSRGALHAYGPLIDVYQVYIMYLYMGIYIYITFMIPVGRYMH